MKENTLVMIASVLVRISDIKAQVEKAKQTSNGACFSWATVAGLLDELRDKNKDIMVGNQRVSLESVVSDLNKARATHHYATPCFGWELVESLCEMVENQSEFRGKYFFLNEDGKTQIQESATLRDGDWFMIKQGAHSFHLYEMKNRKPVLMDTMFSSFYEFYYELMAA